jgi:6-pyruvoyltetrahydropterin/6-carboxytetrahydropterin synthase
MGYSQRGTLIREWFGNEYQHPEGDNFEKVINKIDHKNINNEVDFMKGKVATTENLAIKIWDELKPSIEKKGAILHCIKIEETENNSVEYYG